MKNRKNNKITLFTIFAIIITIIALIATSGTYAKYTSTLNANASEAEIAKWSVWIDNNQLGKTTTPITFDIFETINDTAGSGSTETDVYQSGLANSKNIIAPGTCGEKSFNIINKSDVNVHLDINVTLGEDNPDIPILFALGENGADTSDLEYYSAEEFVEALKINSSTGQAKIDVADTIPYAGDKESGEKIELTLYWKWDFEHTDPDLGKTERDKSDTAIGLFASTSPLTYEVGLSFTATQID